MLLEVARRLTLDGHEVYLVDPESILPAPDPGDGGRVVLVDDLGDLDDLDVSRSRWADRSSPSNTQTRPHLAPPHEGKAP